MANNHILPRLARLLKLDSNNIPILKTDIFPISASTSSNALTVTLNPCTIEFRSSTLNNGLPTTRTVPSPVSLTVPSGATLGTTASTSERLIVLAFDNDGTVELGIANYSSGTHVDEWGMVTTSALSTGSDSANIFYSTSARISKPYRIVGFITSSQTTPGLWAVAPTLVQGNGTSGVNMTGFGFRASTKGYQRLPSGIILQWGKEVVPAGVTNGYSFPIAFSNQCYSFTVGARWESAGDSAYMPGVTNLTYLGFSLYNASSTSSLEIYWMAVGS